MEQAQKILQNLRKRYPDDTILEEEFNKFRSRNRDCNNGVADWCVVSNCDRGIFNSMIQGTELFPGDFSSVARGSVCAESPFVLRAVRGWIFLMC